MFERKNGSRVVSNATLHGVEEGTVWQATVIDFSDEILVIRLDSCYGNQRLRPLSIYSLTHSFWWMDVIED